MGEGLVGTHGGMVGLRCGLSCGTCSRSCWGEMEPCGPGYRAARLSGFNATEERSGEGFAVTARERVEWGTMASGLLKKGRKSASWRERSSWESTVGVVEVSEQGEAGCFGWGWDVDGGTAGVRVNAFLCQEGRREKGVTSCVSWFPWMHTAGGSGLGSQPVLCSSRALELPGLGPSRSNQVPHCLY